MPVQLARERFGERVARSLQAALEAIAFPETLDEADIWIWRPESGDELLARVQLDSCGDFRIVHQAIPDRCRDSAPNIVGACPSRAPSPVAGSISRGEFPALSEASKLIEATHRESSQGSDL